MLFSRLIPIDGYLLLLSLRDNGESRDGRLRGRHDAFQQRAEMSKKTFHPVGIEEVRTVFETKTQAIFDQ